MDLKRIEAVCEKHGAGYMTDAPIAPFTTFGIGGECGLLVKAVSKECIRDVAFCCKECDVSLRVLGKGSNVLVSDEGVRGVVMLLGRDFEGVMRGGRGETLHALAGTSLTSLATCAREYKLTGLEFAYGIPGSVGGAVYMNAGAYGGEIADKIVSCVYLDEDCEIKQIPLKKTDFAYRKSPFTGTMKIVISAAFKLPFGEKEQINATMDDYMERRKTKQPLDLPSAGSTFKRPEGDYASRLIDMCGLKGFAVGGAQVSEKHAGFIVNRGGATCGDVLRLIEQVKERVYKETGIMLEREVEVLK